MKKTFLAILWVGVSLLLGCVAKQTDHDKAGQNEREDPVKRIEYQETKYLSELLNLFPEGYIIDDYGALWPETEFHIGFKNEMKKKNPEGNPIRSIFFIQENHAFHYWFVWDKDKKDWKFLLGAFYDKDIMF